MKAYKYCYKCGSYLTTRLTSEKKGVLRWFKVDCFQCGTSTKNHLTSSGAFKEWEKIQHEIKEEERKNHRI